MDAFGLWKRISSKSTSKVTSIQLSIQLVSLPNPTYHGELRGWDFSSRAVRPVSNRKALTQPPGERRSEDVVAGWVWKKPAMLNGDIPKTSKNWSMILVIKLHPYEGHYFLKLFCPTQIVMGYGLKLATKEWGIHRYIQLYTAPSRNFKPWGEGY